MGIKTLQDIYDYFRKLGDNGYTREELEELAAQYAGTGAIVNGQWDSLLGMAIDDPDLRKTHEGMLGLTAPTMQERLDSGEQGIDLLDDSGSRQATRSAPQIDWEAVDYYRNHGIPDEDIAEILELEELPEKPLRGLSGTLGNESWFQSENDPWYQGDMQAPTLAGERAGLGGTMMPMQPLAPRQNIAPIPGQQELTEIRQAPRADTQQAAENLGVPVPDGVQLPVEQAGEIEMPPLPWWNSETGSLQGGPGMSMPVAGPGQPGNMAGGMEAPLQPYWNPETGSLEMGPWQAAPVENGEPEQTMARYGLGDNFYWNGEDISQVPEMDREMSGEKAEQTASMDEGEFGQLDNFYWKGERQGLTGAVEDRGEAGPQATNRSEAGQRNRKPAKPKGKPIDFEGAINWDRLDNMTPEELAMLEDIFSGKGPQVVRTGDMPGENTDMTKPTQEGAYPSGKDTGEAQPESGPGEDATGEESGKSRKDETPEDHFRKELPLVGRFEKGVIGKRDGKSAIQVAMDWVREHIKAAVKAVNGNVVEVTPRGVKNSFSHGMYGAKLDAVQAIQPVLAEGAFIDEREDKDGKKILNRYYAGRAVFAAQEGSPEEKVVFVRTRQAEGQGERFYVHEVFTEDDINESVAHATAARETDQEQFHGPQDYYKKLIARYLEVKEKNAGKPSGTVTGEEKPLSHWTRDKLLAEARRLGADARTLKGSKGKLADFIARRREEEPKEFLGQNSDGDEVWLDGHGARVLVREGKKIGSQTVAIDVDGIHILSPAELYDGPGRNPKFLTTEELAEFGKASKPEPNDIASGKKEETDGADVAGQSVVGGESQLDAGLRTGTGVRAVADGQGEDNGEAQERGDVRGGEGAGTREAAAGPEAGDTSGNDLPADGGAGKRSARGDEGGDIRVGNESGENGTGRPGRDTGEQGDAASGKSEGKKTDERKDTAGRESGGSVEVSDGQELNSRNHVIGPDDVVVPGGPVARAKANIEAIRIVKALEAEGREATEEEKKKLAQFTGWGSLAQMVFDPAFEEVVKWEANGVDWKEWYDGEQLRKRENWVRDYGRQLHPRLGGMLTQEEWNAAARSTLNAHYTDRKVIGAMWKMAQRLGFAGGRVLEPSAGSGLFFGLMPRELSANSRLTGVELDSMTGLILKHLYPDADIQITGFQNAKRVGDNTQDLVISNVPFGDYPVADRKRPQYAKQSIHNYFFSRAIDATKPGGLCILISTHHTLDAVNGKLREEWGKKADLVGAVRLPGNAFEKNAGTTVTTDIVIFRKKSNSRFEGGQNFRNVAPVAAGDGTASVNEYFVAHPEMVLGEHSLEGSMYGGKDEYTLNPVPGMDLEGALLKAVENLPENVFGAERKRGAARADATEKASDNMRNGRLVEMRDGGIGIVQDGEIHKLSGLKKGEEEACRSYLQVKDVLERLMDAMNRDTGNERVDELREELNGVYDEFYKKHGGVNDPKNNFLENDIEFFNVAALENVEWQHEIRMRTSGRDKGKQYAKKVMVITKGDIFKKRTVFPFMEPESAANVEDAVKLSRIYRGGIDLEYVGRLLGMNEEQAREALLRSREVFENPGTGLLEPKEEYLSGNVRRKLDEAKAAAEDNEAYRANVEALEGVQPEWIGISDIRVRLGSTWLDADVYEGFLRHLGVNNPKVAVIRDNGAEGTTRYVIREGWSRNADIAAKFSTSEKKMLELVEDCLNMKQATVRRKDEQGAEREDTEASAVAREKQRLLQEEFTAFLVNSEEYGKKAEELYNWKVNHSVLRKYEVPDIRHYPGASRDIELRPNQKQGVARALSESCLLAHGVGSGKTMLQTTIAMEARRIGTARKPLIVVQGSTLNQFAASFKKLYPGAKILAPTDKQRNAKNRQRLMAQMATGDWDAVIVPHSFFNNLDVRPETEKRFVDEQIAEIDAQLKAGVEDGRTRKQLEKTKERLLAAIEKKLSGKRDAVYWDDLGVDMLIVDEAHAYKRGFFATKMGNVKGLDKANSQRSMQLLMKSRIIHEKTGGKNVILATGTPISNTLTEMWTMLRYVRPDLLKDYHVEQFDDFASMFTTTTQQFEQTQSGEYKTVERFNRYVNGPEVLKLWRSVADVVLTEDLDFIKNMPKLKGGAVESVVCDLTEDMDRFIKAVQELRKKWDNSGGDKKLRPAMALEIDIMLRKASVDPRLIPRKNLSELGIGEFGDDPRSKLNTAVRNIYERYRRDGDFLGTQLVFADLFRNEELGFNVFEEMRDKLVALGVPREEIAIIHEYEKDEQREKLFERVNSGEVRILFGTTEKLGVGVNVQERMSALHHLDAPPRPMDFEQRNGRIRRPGNQNQEVEVLAYGVERTPDAAAFHRLASKQRFINQLLRGDLTGRSFENPLDEQQMTFEDLEAAYSGDPRIQERNELLAKLGDLETRERGHLAQKRKTEQEIRTLRDSISHAEGNLRENVERSEFLKKYFPNGELEDRKRLQEDVSAWIADTEKKMLEKLKADYRDPGLWNGSNLKKYLKLRELDLGHDVKATLLLKPDAVFNKEEGRHEWDIIGEYTLKGPWGIAHATQYRGAQGLFRRIGNVLEGMSHDGEMHRQHIAKRKAQLAAKEKAVAEPFAQAEELERVRKRIAELEKELAGEGREEDSVASIRPGEFLPARTGLGRGSSLAEVEKVAQGLNGLAKNAVPVSVVQSFEELPEWIRKRFAGYELHLEGMYVPATGKVWLVADNLSSPQRAAEVWCHEQIVHNGLRGLFNEGERKRVLNQLWLAMGGMGNELVKQVADVYGMDPRGSEKAREVVMEEVVANLAEKRQAELLTKREESIWQRLVRAVMDAWNALVAKVTGKKGEMGMEQVDALLSRLGRYVMNGESVMPRESGEAQASIGERGETNSYGIPMERVTEIEEEFTREQAQEALIALKDKELPNLIEDLTANVNSTQRRELTSGAREKRSQEHGFTRGEHNAIAAQIANAWKWSAEVRGAGGSKAQDSNVNIRRFVSPLRIKGRDVFGWFSIKESKEGLRIYSVELVNEEELKNKISSAITDGQSESTRAHLPGAYFENLLERIAGPVKNSPALAAINLRDILNWSTRQSANAASAPEIEHFFRKDDLSLLKRICALPHWIAKESPAFARIYERQLKRQDEKNQAVAKSLQEVPSLFGKDKLGKADMDSLRKLIWEIEGKPLPFEKAGGVAKYREAGKLANGRTKLEVNPDFYDEYEKALGQLKATPAARKAMLEIRKSLDGDWAMAYNRMAEMDEMDQSAIDDFRQRIGKVYNYFPHHRYGKYYVQAIDPDGKVVYREHFDAMGVSAAKKKAREIAAREMANYPDAEWSDGKNEKLPDEILGAPIDSEAMEQIIKAATSKLADQEQAAKIRKLLCASVADVLKSRGWGSHAIGRKGVPGHETEDIVKVYYDYTSGLHGWLSKMEASRDFTKGLSRINAKRQPRLWSYSAQYTEDMLRNADSLDRLVGDVKGVAFAWYLGANIKSAMVNATQNLIVGVPRLDMDVQGGGRIWMKSAMDILAKRIMGKGNLSAEEEKLVTELYEQKVITDAYMTEVRGHMEGMGLANGWNKFTQILGWPMSEVERFNRASLALAAFRAVRAGKLKQKAKERHGITGTPTYEQAKAFAREVVLDSHFVYGKSNMPEFMRSSVAGRLASSGYTFRTFSHNMLNMWLWAFRTQGKDGAKFIAKSLGATLALGGVTALPFYGTVIALCSLIGGGDDDWTEEIRKQLPNDNLTRDIVCYGMPALGGINLGGSLQMETPATRGLKRAESLEEFPGMVLGDVIGIPWDMVKKGMRSIEYGKDGDWWRSLEELLPTFTKNGLQAWRLWTEGQTTRKGKPVNAPGQTEPRKLTGTEAILKVGGFQPVSSTKAWEAHAADQRREGKRSAKIGELAAKVIRAQKAGRPLLPIWKEMEAWNEERKKSGHESMMFTRKDVMKRVKTSTSTRKPNPRTVQRGKELADVWGV